MSVTVLKKSVQAPWQCARVLVLAAAVLLAGCASTNTNTSTDATRTSCTKDPFEGFNRAMFGIHEGVDSVVLRPVARGYDAVVPMPVKMSFGNFRDNLWEISRGTNAFLQGKPEEGATGFGRLLINSTVGIFGLFDVASEMGLAEGDEDLGQTLAVWGVGSGPYLFFPVVGPSNVRDFSTGIVEQYFYPFWYHVENVPVRNSFMAWRIVDLRASLLPADRVMDEAALDRYAYMRSAFFQRRMYQIYDGSPPAADDLCN